MSFQNRNEITSKKEALWLLCFDDEPNTPKELFSLGDIETLCSYQDNELIAMATLVPVKTNTDLKGYYAYGVCTHPDHRGKGLFKRIMEDCERYARDKNSAFLCLIAADRALADTYRRMGYSFSVSLAGEDTPGKAIKIRSLSEAFAKFAEPDEIVDTEELYGLLKPLFSANEDLKFAFSEHMGEI